MIAFWIDLGTDFDRFWAPTWPPVGESNVGILEHFRLLGPSWGQDPPKTPPRGLPGAILGPKLVDFRHQVGQFGGCRHPNSQAIHQPFNQTTKICMSCPPRPHSPPRKQTRRTQPLDQTSQARWRGCLWQLDNTTYNATYNQNYNP